MLVELVHWCRVDYHHSELDDGIDSPGHHLQHRVENQVSLRSWHVVFREGLSQVFHELL